LTIFSFYFLFLLLTIAFVFFFSDEQKMNPTDGDSPNIMSIPTLKLDDKNSKTRAKTNTHTKSNSFFQKINL